MAVKNGPLSRPNLHILVIVILGLLVYSNTFHSPFQWDESEFIEGNPVVRDLDYFKQPSRAEDLPFYDSLKSRYVGYLTFALNYRSHGFDVVGYHIVNLFIHISSAVLVYFLVLLTFRTPYFGGPGIEGQEAGTKSAKRQQGIQTSVVTEPGSRIPSFVAFFTALLFVAHPVQTEAVTYVFQRFASLVSFFYLLSLVLYIKGRLISQRSAVSSRQSAVRKGLAIHDPRFAVVWYLLSFVSALLAMKTKENAFTLPAVMTLYEFLFFTGPMKPRVLRLVPFLFTMLIVPLTLIGIGKPAGEIISQIKDPVSLGYEDLPGDAYLFTQFRVIVTYVRLLFLPINQNLVYDYPVYRSFLNPAVMVSFVFLLALFCAAAYLLYKSREVVTVSGQKSRIAPAFHNSLFTIHLLRLMAFGIFWFFVTLSVESSIIPIPMVIDEYRVYLPAVGFFLAVVSGASLLMRQCAFLTGARVVAGFLVLILLLASAAFARNILWKDKVSLWADVTQKSPASVRGHNNLGRAYAAEGRYEKAIEMYERTIALDPKFSLAYSNLGVAYATTARTDMAINSFTQAIATNPRNTMAYANLGRAYGESGRFDKAVESYRKAIALKPYDGGLYHGLGTAYALLGRIDDALAAYTKFAELSPNDAEAYRSRGMVFLKKNDLASAFRDFQKACSLGNSESCGYLKNSQTR